MGGPVMVVGVDGCPKGWVAVFLRDGTFLKAEFYPTISGLLEESGEVSTIAVDIPIGSPEGFGRQADSEARKFLGPRASSVFPMPPMDVLKKESYEEANAFAKARWERGISRQSFALRDKILEVAEYAKDKRIREVHPEVSFQAMAGNPLEHSKKTWNGLAVRRQLLRSVGIETPDGLGEAGAFGAPDDVLDAAAAAWSAARIAGGENRSLPTPPEPDANGYPMAVWY